MSYRSIAVRRINPHIGAEISNIDLSRPLTNTEVEDLHAALADHLVLFFHDQEITLENHETLARHFGELHVHAASRSIEGHPGVLRIHIDENTKVIPGYDWHADASNEPEPPLGSILQLHVVPETGGDTLFASMYAAYDALSDRLKAYLEGLTAIHDGNYTFREMHIRNGTYDPERTFHRSSHPVIARHPVTQRKLLYVNPTYTIAIEGVPERESRAIFDFLFRHIERPEFQVRFKWRSNSIAFWDNRAAQHLATWDYFPQRRSGIRVGIAGSAPVAA